jgi:hypothetical protein
LFGHNAIRLEYKVDVSRQNLGALICRRNSCGQLAIDVDGIIKNYFYKDWLNWRFCVGIIQQANASAAGF